MKNFVKPKTYLFLILLMMTTGHAQKLKITGTLSPVGTFPAETTSVKGVIEKKGAGKATVYTGKNIEVDLRTLVSDMSMRTEHLHNHLETKKFPKAVLTSGVGKNGEFIGNLSLHGQKKRVSGTYTIKDKTGTAEFRIKMSDFKLKKASYAFVEVDDEVSIQVEMPVP